MKLSLSVALVVLALAVLVESAPQDPTLTERFNNFQTQVETLTQDLTEKTKAAMEELHNSEFSVNARNWFKDTFENLKKQMDEAFANIKPQ
ncbi:apolipoprotein C-I-like [Acipenser oxyrinchus oxyrinchus]|uniref:Apolipoprotein C-I-like n=1 Tax=Acipenser oxyrinchus oxyrinchus TaxID=40147 RepID=A0AAD8FP76_ACIOX|nr:apolipoprotein C-I-like [Acipenser oxyrinchus oxyrinchus]